MKLLVADDDLMSQRLIMRFLSRPKLEIMSASDGRKALGFFKLDSVPDIAILDWMMPELSGLELCRKIRALNLPNYTYIILLTGRDSKVDMLAGLEAGADDYLTKPCIRDELIARVQAGIRLLEREFRLTSESDLWRSMLDHIPFGVACLTGDGVIQRANQTFCEQLWYQALTSLRGRNLSSLLVAGDPANQNLLASISNSEPFEAVEAQMIRRGGSTCPLWVSGCSLHTPWGPAFQVVTRAGCRAH